MQYLNSLEGLMYYAVTQDQGVVTERSLTTIIRLHDIHAQNSELLQKASLISKKSTKKKSDLSDHDLSRHMRMSTSHVTFKPDNIWDVQSIYSFLKALYL